MKKFTRLMTLLLVLAMLVTVAGAKEMLLNEGFQDFLAKPIELATMHRILDKYLPDSKKQFQTVFDETVSATVTIISVLILIGFASLMCLLFWFKRFDLMKQYYDEKNEK